MVYNLSVTCVLANRKATYLSKNWIILSYYGTWKKQLNLIICECDYLRWWGKISWLGQKKICVFTVRRLTLIFAPTLNFFMALLVENYLNTLFLPSSVVFDV